MELVGGADGIRTHDLLDAIEARSQLRHGPTVILFLVYHIRASSPPAGTLLTLLILLRYPVRSVCV
jgi:hypothetical protein